METLEQIVAIHCCSAPNGSDTHSNCNYGFPSERISGALQELFLGFGIEIGGCLVQN